MKRQILALDPQTYQRHLLHGENRIWAETNCYVDLWIELLHGYGFEPMAALPFALGIDFEGDQWTFYKFPLADLDALYGADVQELNIWRTLIGHVCEQVDQGRPVLVELDSFYLPDTAGTAYKLGHVKTTVAVNAIDLDERYLGYFHNQGYFALTDEDFVRIFHLNGLPDPHVLPPYVEFVKFRAQDKLQGAELLNASLRLLAKHLRQLPKENPFAAFQQRLQRDFDWLMQEPIETFHQYSFASLRQLGSCFELCATYLQWLQAQGQKNLEAPTAAFLEIANSAKTFQFQLARAMNRKKPLDLATIEAMGQRWEGALGQLRQQYG